MNNISLKVFLKSILLCLTINFFLSAQVTSSVKIAKIYPFVVDSIRISGLKITEEFIVYRELTFSVGDTLDAKKTDFNRERIYSLGIFNHVFLIPTRIDNKNILNIDIEESWYIYPIPFLEIKGDNNDQLTFGVRLRLRNFRGRNETLRANLAFGYDPSYIFSYSNPNIIGRENIFIGASFGYSNITNKSWIAEAKHGSQFSQKFVSTNFVFGKRFGLYHRLSLNMGYAYIKTPFFTEGINASNNRIDHLVSVGLNYEYDTRDLAQFPRSGIFAITDFSFKGLGIDGISYQVAKFDFKDYQTIFNKLITKWRAATRLTYGSLVPHYDMSILGLDDRVRGHGSERTEGNYYYLFSLEFYYPIIEEWNVKLNFIPFLPEELLSYRIGLYAQIFGDAGATQLKNQKIGLSDFDSGYGAGLTFLFLPYNILRVEFALDEFGNTSWIVNLGISF